MLNALPPIPTRISLTDAQRRAARGGMFDLPGHGAVQYRGSNPLGEPRVAPGDDYHGTGSYDLCPADAAILGRMIAARYDAAGRSLG